MVHHHHQLLAALLLLLALVGQAVVQVPPVEVLQVQVLVRLLRLSQRVSP